MRLRFLIVFLLIPRLAFADPVVPIPPGEDKIVVLKQGAQAPFTGQLFDSPTALRWANYLEQYKFRLKADVELQKSTDQAEINYQKRLVQVEQDRYNRVVQDLEKRLAACEQDPPFYKTVWFGIVLGVLATSTIVGLSVWGLSAAK